MSLPTNQVDISVKFFGNATDYQEFKTALQELLDRSPVSDWTIVATPNLPKAKP